MQVSVQLIGYTIKCKQWSLYEAYRTRLFLLYCHHTSVYSHINKKKKMDFLTALKSSKSLSSLSVPKAAIRC